MIIPALFLIVAARAHDIDWRKDPLPQAAAVLAEKKKDKKDESKFFSAVAAPDSAKLSADELACQPDVIEGFKKIFQQAGNGAFDTEAAMRVDFYNGRRVIMISPLTHDFKKMNVPIMVATIAIAHTHPMRSAGSGQPSSKDEESPVPNFVVTPMALWVTVPHPAKHQPHSRQLRGSDWSKPCPAAK